MDDRGRCGDRRTLERRIQGMEKCSRITGCLEAGPDAEYAAVDIDLADIKEPNLCAPGGRTTSLSASTGERLTKYLSVLA